MTALPESINDRRAEFSRLLALSSWPEVDRLTASYASIGHQILRGPETGLVMLRGRMGATGAPFNFGEATVTRCSVRLDDNTEGHAYVLGRDGAKARRMALCDALLQQETTDLGGFDAIANELTARLQQRRSDLAARVSATKVDFFTVVRGDV